MINQEVFNVEGQQSVDFSKRIGFGRRFGASILDVLIGSIGGIFFSIVFGASLGALIGVAVNNSSAGFLGAFIGFIFGFIIFNVLYGLIEGFFGASIGKMMLGIKIANEDGTTANKSKYFTRYLIKNIILIGTTLGYLTGIEIIKTISNYAGFVVFIGLFFIFGVARQTLHDKIAKTAVFFKKDIVLLDNPNSQNKNKLFFGIIVVFALVALGVFGYFTVTKNKLITPLDVKQDVTPSQTFIPTPVTQTPPTQTSPQNNSTSTNCGTIYWDTFFKAAGLFHQPLADSEKASLACTDKALLDCSPATLNVDNQSGNAGFFMENNYKILGVEGEFCKVSVEGVYVKTQKVKTGICKIPKSDIAKIILEKPYFSLLVFMPVATSVIQGKPEHPNWECSFN